MRKTLVVLFLIMIVLPMTADKGTFDSLWEKVEEAGQKDLPRTQYDVLQQIVAKAQKEKAYGQLLKAELKGASVMASVAPDSLLPAVERIEQRYQHTQDETLQTVYRAVLNRIYRENRQLEKKEIPFELSQSLCSRLAAVKAAAYKPFIQKGIDSRIFDDDLLSVIAYETRQYQPASDYYLLSGNRRAACLTALEALRENYHQMDADTKVMGRKAYLHSLDSLIRKYDDLDVSGEVAIEYYEQSSFESIADRMTVLRGFISRWGDRWKRINQLRNTEQQLTLPMFRMEIPNKLMRPDQPQVVRLAELRNLSSVTLKVYKANVKGDVRLNPSNEKDYQRLKPSLQLLPELTQTRTFAVHPDYEVFEDSLVLGSLPHGVYMIEASSAPGTQVCRSLYFVSDLFVMSQILPKDKVRFVVVNSTTGQPVSGATVRLTIRKNYDKAPTVIRLTTDEQGEATYTYGRYRPSEVYAYSNQDVSCPEYYLSGNFSYYDHRQRVEQTVVYTDRQIYRPGQTVHFSAITYATIEGYQHEVVAGKEVNVVLLNANSERVAEKTLKTDAFGTCAADFILPSTGLNGHYSLRIDNGYHGFMVEEYKRPTFQVEFPQVGQTYQKGDTLTVKAYARSYAGVPVQGAKVRYQVVRRRAFWWCGYSHYWNRGGLDLSSADKVLAEELTSTADDGTFEVRVPMMVPDTDYTMFYHFVVTADVTDVSGETHHGELSLPLGNKSTVLTCDLPNQVRADQLSKVIFRQKNAAGNDVPADVRYQWDGGKWKTTSTQTPVMIPALMSGQHTLTAVCGTDTLKHTFVVFALNDKKPCVKTDDWFYVSDTAFPQDGNPVTVQVGSSAEDVHIVYSILSGEKVLESGAVERSNALLNRQFTYQESYQNGLLLTFSWVKNGVCYHHEATIRRPLPDKKLSLQWETFRDRLIPGQQESWTLRVRQSNGKPADAQMMAVLYDKSLDQLAKNEFTLNPYTWIPLPSAQWMSISLGGISRICQQEDRQSFPVPSFEWSHFDDNVFPTYFVSRNYRIRGRYAAPVLLAKGSSQVMNASADMVEMKMAKSAIGNAVEEAFELSAEATQPTVEMGDVQFRENLQETAFFYPQLMTDPQGMVAIQFSLPESLTTWRFVGIAHTRQMDEGYIEAEAIAQKPVMIQPNMPRFIRRGDQSTISARLTNTTEQVQTGVAVLQLTDPLTEKIVLEQSATFSLSANATQSVTFDVDARAFDPTLLVCKVVAKGEQYSDGEQHYLPVLSDEELVTVTVPFTQTEPGIKRIEIPLPQNVKDNRITIEYTNNPAWLMVQTLPSVGNPSEYNAVDQAASYYANAIAQYLIDQHPRIKTIFDQWMMEQGNESSLMSALEKNQELKELVLEETPWVMDAKSETTQRKQLSDFFETNQMKARQDATLRQLEKLQLGDGGFCWWKGMPSSLYMTVAVSEMLVRLNAMTGKHSATSMMLSRAFDYMGSEMVKLVDEMKKEEKKGHHPIFPNHQALQWLYLCKLDGRTLPQQVQVANAYLTKLLKKEVKNQSIYEKALSAMILQNKTYVQSIKEYTVWREDMGRYFDTPRAGYSWHDYRIPTQVAAIEAIQMLTPADTQTIMEMQRWLLQEKRTQAWSTPINSVNAVYAFLHGNQQALSIEEQQTVLTIDGKVLDLPKATAGIGYVKTVVTNEQPKTFSAEKTSEGTSWGALYMQFMQKTKEIADQGSEITVKREIIPVGTDPLRVGDRVKVRLTIVAARDLDFVQIVDKRAACMEPVEQLSGYRRGVYCSPKDYTTHYYMDRLVKGKHILETEYYIDRIGVYETGTCTVQCAYAPEFRATCSSKNIVVK